MRYAVYLTPPDGAPLAEAAATWLGRSPFPGPAGPAAAPALALPEVPARYGFHATMRAPFVLAEGRTEADLLAAFEAFAAQRSVLHPVLAIAPLSRFVAFRSDDPALSRAAQETVEAFEPLRAPLTEADRARRSPDKLTSRELDLLERWGYPYVMERFVFHMTLSGPVGESLDTVTAAAKSHFGALDGAPHPLILAIYREDEPGGPFHVIATQNAAASSNSDRSR
ncbi:hypothetical protein DLJ53_05895 [Acuticoccus sediminis]|uniref:Phosphonate metabolism protein n=1 Tax=Acuticoccus sediminis TaxID=2184697 RepID=A0A8B2P0L6_9HYPH|nr:DUF1045 domain-containing protein [Acuticoccus sediminis]RAI03995.1 hypothetical protein DLJ53_05895 [Acuticoccus sediminis]